MLKRKYILIIFGVLLLTIVIIGIFNFNVVFKLKTDKSFDYFLIKQTIPYITIIALASDLQLIKLYQLPSFISTSVLILNITNFKQIKENISFLFSDQSERTFFLEDETVTVKAYSNQWIQITFKNDEETQIRYINYYVNMDNIEIKSPLNDQNSMVFEFNEDFIKVHFSDQPNKKYTLKEPVDKVYQEDHLSYSFNNHLLKLSYRNNTITYEIIDSKTRIVIETNTVTDQDEDRIIYKTITMGDYKYMFHYINHVNTLDNLTIVVTDLENKLIISTGQYRDLDLEKNK